MSQTTEFNYVYRTMKMLEHLAATLGYEYDPNGRPIAGPLPTSGPATSSANHHPLNKDCPEAGCRNSGVHGHVGGYTTPYPTDQRPEVHAEKLAPKPEYTPNCLVCGVSRFFANTPVRNASHGTACQYYEPAPLTKPEPEPEADIRVKFDYTEPQAAESRPPSEVVRSARAAAKGAKASVPGISRLLLETADALETALQEAAKEPKKRYKHQEKLLEEISGIARDQGLLPLSKVINIDRVLRKRK